MTREEILAKSREENANGDELEKHIILRSHSASCLTGFILGLIVNLLNWFLDGPRIIIPAIWLIVWGMLASAMWTKTIAKKDRSNLTISVLYTVIALLHGASFLFQLINW